MGRSLFFSTMRVTISSEVRKIKGALDVGHIGIIVEFPHPGAKYYNWFQNQL